MSNRLEATNYRLQSTSTNLETVEMRSDDMVALGRELMST